MRAVRSLAVLAGVAGCHTVDFDVVSSSVEAGPPPTPVYQRTVQDAVTGDNTPVQVTGNVAPCPANQKCFVADPGADSYTEDLYERPAGQGSLARIYAPAIDIVTGQAGITSDWFYYRINLYGVEPGQQLGSAGSLPYHYGVEMNIDSDVMGDLIVDVTNPSGNLGVNWGTTGITVKSDQNETMGGPNPLLPDGPGQAGGGYEHKEFDAGQNSATGQPGGATAVQARINGAAVEIAIYRPFLAAVSADHISAMSLRPYADSGQVSTSQLYTHDDKNRNGIGSPYPWLALSGAPAACPAGSSGDANLTAAQIAALESGTNVNTGITNPCYATGGIYLRDNAGTIHDLARHQDLQVDVDLTLTKTDNADPVGPGDAIIYTITVTNTSTGIVTGARVTDQLPTNVTFISASAGCSYNMLNRTVTCTLDALAPAAVRTLTVTVGTTELGTVTNTASVTSDGDELTPTNNTDTATTAVMNLCGNGALNAGEICDDGNATNGDGCNTDCKLSNGETCTGNMQCSSGICDPTSTTCEPANTCGNGTIELANNEVCDDGNTTGGDGCEGDCKLSNGQTCSGDAQCSSGLCNPSNVCATPASCGNGVLDPNESCDDGNMTGGDGCEIDCKRSNGQTCSQGTQCHSGVCDPTSNTCEPANTCGNGLIEGTEVCDDGNTTAGDGCEADCKLPDGSTCTGNGQCHSGVCDPMSNTCEPANTCGNSVVETGESCDDGNTAAGDGCSAGCKIEDGYACEADNQCASNFCDPTTNTCGGTDTDGDGVYDNVDIDDDNDGVLDVRETDDTDGDHVVDMVDLDSDNDGIPDATEAGHMWGDRDGNFVMDCPASYYGNNGFCDALETAPDSGIPLMVFPLDTDHDGVPDLRDLDSDNDSLADAIENGTPGCEDTNNDGVCDGIDSDGDGIVGTLDVVNTGALRWGTLNAPLLRDTDDDGAPDVRDLDSDGDTVFDILESKNAGLDLTKDGVVDAIGDKDNDGVRDVADDSDLDTVPDAVDPDPAKFGGLHDGRVDSDGDGKADFQDLDSDADGIWDGGDNCRIRSNADQADADSDRVGDACDGTDDRDWGVSGGCAGCATNGSSPGSLLLALCVLGMITLRRRRRIATVAIGGALAALPSVAAAQSAPQQVPGDFATERLQLATDRDGIIDVESGSVRRHLEIDLGLWLGYARDPLVLNRNDLGHQEVGALVANQVSGELVAALGLFDRIQLAVAMPLVLAQSDNISTALMAPTAPAGGFAIGDLRLVPKLQLLEQSVFGVDLAVLATITLPTSSGEGFNGDTGMTFAPTLALSHRFDTGMRTALSAGYRTRKERMALDLEINDEVFAGAGVAYDFAAHTGLPVELDASFAIATGANDIFGAFNRNYAEVKAGGTVDIPGPLVAFAAGGFGVAEGWGTPDWRLLAGVRLDRAGAPTHTRAVEIPIVDTDRDGILDAQDRCPTDAEDVDQFEDTDGCPDTDDDHDGVADATDACRLEPEDRDGFEDTDGCPETNDDRDHDGVVDTSDKCPTVAEDLDGFEDTDGCPDEDNDHDSVADAQDQCPLVVGSAENHGCPPPDRDNDGVPDHLDNCPTWKGKAENNGCALPQLVQITESKLQVKDTTWFASGKSVLQKRANKQLDQVANVIRAHPEMNVTIEGHTDSVGSDAKNMKLSQARADAVKAYLVKRGVDASRLTAIGFGETRPVADNKTKAGRAANRRVEFTTTRVVTTTTVLQPTSPAPAKATPAPAPALERPE